MASCGILYRRASSTEDKEAVNCEGVREDEIKSVKISYKE
jgi:hypothetical protein